MIKNYFFLIVGLAIILGSIFLFLKQPVKIGDEIKFVKINNNLIEVEVADTPEARGQGLSGREVLASDAGMLFVFPKPVRDGFWMKDMHFSIDIVWISEDLEIVGIERDVSPETFPEAFHPKEPVKYVLELVGGKSQNSDIDIGQTVYFE